MAKASIHFSPIKGNSEAHNERSTKLDYNYPDLEKNNETFVLERVDARIKAINSHCKKVSGRKLQKNAEPVREAVVNLNANHTMEDLKRLSKVLKEKKGIDCFQIHIHRDEGKSRDDLNYHAHMIFDWQDKTTGKTLKLNRTDLSEIQDICASTLQMQRGELRVNSNRERLEAVEYKRIEETKKLIKERKELADLERRREDAIFSLSQKEIKLDYIKKEIVAGMGLKTPPDSFQNILEERNQISKENNALRNKILAVEVPVYMILNNQPISENMKMRLAELFPHMQMPKKYQVEKTPNQVQNTPKKNQGMGF